MGNYKPVTNQILTLHKVGRQLVSEFDSSNSNMHQGSNESWDDLLAAAKSGLDAWTAKCVVLLEDSGLEIERLQLLQATAPPTVPDRYNFKLAALRGCLIARLRTLTEISQKIESTKCEKTLVKLTVDDLDCFRTVSQVSPNDVLGFARSAFLEDDVEEAFLDALGEPYKELDSGAETRDLFTDHLCCQGKRLSTAIMFKGRSVAGALSLRECGSRGNQLLKLAKNNAAECFIVQHVNKIESDVRETLIDLVLMNTRFPTVYVGFIDGVDTARVLKSLGLNLSELAEKKSNRSSRAVRKQTAKR